MIIRDALLNDAEAIARVHVQSWKTTYTGLMPDDAIASRTFEVRKRQWQHNLNPDNRQSINLVAEVDGKIVGFVSGGKPQEKSEFDCELYAIYLLKDAQGKGIGQQLMQALAKQLHGNGHKTMFLSVLKGNEASSGFYKAMGGAVVLEGAYQVTKKITLITVNYGWDDIGTLLVES